MKPPSDPAATLGFAQGLASGLETLFSRVREGTLPLDQRMTRVIHQVLEASEECVGALRENRIPEEPAAALRAMEGLLAGGADLPIPSSRKALAAALPVTPPSEPRADMVRMPAEDLDRLVRSTGRILTESLQQASVTAELDEVSPLPSVMLLKAVPTAVTVPVTVTVEPTANPVLGTVLASDT